MANMAPIRHSVTASKTTVLDISHATLAYSILEFRGRGQ